MTDNVSVGKVEAGIGLDLTPLQKGVRDAGKLLNQLTKQMEGLSKIQFNPDGILTGVEVASRSLEGLSKAAASVNVGLEKVKFSGTGISTGANTGTKNLNGLAEAAGKTRSALSELNGLRFNAAGISLGTDTAKADLNTLTQAAERTRLAVVRLNATRVSAASLMQRGTHLSSIGGGLRSAGQAATWGYSAPVALGAGYAVKTAMNREDQFADVAKVYPKESQQSLTQARKELVDLTHVLPLTFQQLTQLGNMGGQLGVPIAALGQFTKVAGELGMVTDLSADKATNGLAKIAAAMGLDISTGPGAIKTFHTLGEQLAQMGIEGSATGSEIVRTAQRIASAGKNAGMSTGDVLALSNGLASLGQRAEAGGTAALRTIVKMTLAVQTGNKQLGQYANVAGMSADQFKAYFQSDALGAVLKFTEGLGRLQQSGHSTVAVLSEMGIKNANELIALQNLSHAHALVTKFRNDANKAAADGNVLELSTAKKVSDTASQFKILANNAEEVAGKLGTALIPILTKLEPDAEKLLDTVSHLADGFEKLPEPVRLGMVEFLALTVATGPLLVGMGNVFSIVGSVTRGFAAFKALKTADELKGILTGMRNLETGAGDTETAISKLSTSAGGLKGLLTSPLAEGTLGQLLLKGGIVTLGVGLDVYLLKKDFDTAQETKGLKTNAAAQDGSLGRDGDLQRRTSGAIVNIANAMSALRDGIKGDRAKLADMPRENKPYEFLTGPIRESSRYKDLAARIRKEYADMGALSASRRTQESVLTRLRSVPATFGGTSGVLPTTGPLGRATFGGSQPWAVASGREMGSRFGINDIGGRATSGHIKESDHYTGNALDFMVGGNKAKGDALAAYAVKNAAEEHIKYIIWQQHIFNPSRAAEGWRKMPDRGSATANHMDHVHVSYLPTHGGIAAGGAPAAFNPALFGAPGGAKSHQHILDANYKATHDKYENERHAALETYQAAKNNPSLSSADKKTAHATYLATLVRIHAAIQAEQKKHHHSLETAEATHIGRVQAMYQKGNALAEAAKKHAGEVRQQSAEMVKALQTDPETFALNKEAGAAQNKYNEQKKYMDTGRGLGPFSKAEDKAYNEQLAAGPGTELSLTLADINQRRDAKKQRDADKTVPGDTEATDYTKQTLRDTTELQREVWLHAGGDMHAYFKSLRKEADDALKDVQNKYGVTSKTPNAGAVTAAQGQHDAKFALIGQQEADTARETQDKIARGQEESARFEFQQHMISLGQYRAFLYQKLVATQQYEAGSTTILSEEYMRLKAAYDESLGESKAKVIDVGEAIQSTFQSSTERSIEHFHGMKNAWKEIMGDMKSVAISTIAKIASLWLTSKLFKGAPSLSFGGGSGGGGGNPIAAAAGILGAAKGASAGGDLGSTLGSDPGMSAGGSGNGGLSSLGSLASAVPGGAGVGSALNLASMFGKGGMLGGLWAKGGLMAHGGLLSGSGALGGFGAALPWVGGGLMLNKLLGNPFGKMFKKLHLFSGGGIVPGAGHHDTVPAMLTPGEVVSNHEQQKAQGHSSPVFNFNHYGDVHGVDDMEGLLRNHAWGVSQHLATAVPGN